MSDKVLTEVEAAKMLHMNPAVLAKKRRSGESVPNHSKIGRLVRYLESDVIQFVRDNQCSHGKSD